MATKKATSGGVDAAVKALVQRGRRTGCIELSAVEAVAGRYDLDDDGITALQERIEAAGVPVKDDCGKTTDETTKVSITSMAELPALLGVA